MWPTVCTGIMIVSCFSLVLMCRGVDFACLERSTAAAMSQLVSILFGCCHIPFHNIFVLVPLHNHGTGAQFNRFPSAPKSKISPADCS